MVNKYHNLHILLVRWYIEWSIVDTLTDIYRLFLSWLLTILFFSYLIMLQCWKENPTDRPTFAKLKETMKEMERNHKVFVTCLIFSSSNPVPFFSGCNSVSAKCCFKETFNVLAEALTRIELVFGRLTCFDMKSIFA